MEIHLLAVAYVRSHHLSAETRETRKSREKSRSAGTRLKRYADWQSHSGWYQPPPRITRNEPVAGPVGSSAGHVAE